MELKFRNEKMSDRFEKYHIEGLPFNAVIHKFSALDLADPPHDHPWSFTTHIIKGSYIERIWRILDKDLVVYTDYHRKEGTSHTVTADTIHEIIDLPEGDCYTLVRSGPEEREVYFYNFKNNKYMRRKWDENEYKEINGNN